jgi:hypothetical protein
MSSPYTGGIKQIIPTKKFEDGETSIFASGNKADIDDYRTQSFNDSQRNVSHHDTFVWYRKYQAHTLLALHYIPRLKFLWSTKVYKRGQWVSSFDTK